MPARDWLHHIVIQALIKDGWTITNDPYTIAFGVRRVYVDLGAERLIGAEKESEKIAVEIKSLIGLSPISELEKAVGQYAIYRSWLTRTDPQRLLFLALDSESYNDIFQDIAGQVLLEDYSIRLVVIHLKRQEVIQWIN